MNPWISACNRQTTTLTIGTLNVIKDALIYVAMDEGYLIKNGLNVQLKNYSNGVAAVDGLLNGEVEVAYASEFVTVGKAFEKADISIFVVEAQSTGTFLIGVKDSGIQNIADLKGKKIGVPLGALPEFYLVQFLRLNGLNNNDVTIVNTQPADLPSSLAEGKVDVVVATTRWVYEIRQQLGDKAVYWPAEYGQPGFDTLVSTNRWLKEHPEKVIKILKSLAMAEKYVMKNPAGAQDITNKRLNWDKTYLADQWQQVHFALSLDQSLVAAMNNEARWMIASGQYTEKPDFRNYIYLDGLKSVKPEAVNITR